MDLDFDLFDFAREQDEAEKTAVANNFENDNADAQIPETPALSKAELRQAAMAFLATGKQPEKPYRRQNCDRRDV